MSPITVLFLIALALLILAGTFVGYIYLRQEKTKPFPKSIYDEAQDEIHKGRCRQLEVYKETVKSFAAWLDIFLQAVFSPRSVLLLITFGVALVVTLISVSAIEFNIMAIIIFPFVALLLPLFPNGFFTFLPYSPNSSFGFFL